MRGYHGFFATLAAILLAAIVVVAVVIHDDFSLPE
jgi:uncharacterized membrane protein YphA (DoxX/SURF4 family)